MDGRRCKVEERWGVRMYTCVHTIELALVLLMTILDLFLLLSTEQSCKRCRSLTQNEMQFKQDKTPWQLSRLPDHDLLKVTQEPQSSLFPSWAHN